MSSLNGKLAWITGAGTGIGRGVAVALAEAGMDVALSGRRRTPLDEVTELVETKGRRALAAPLDVMDRNGIARAVANITDTLGDIYLLVNNAGMNTTKRTATEMDPGDWDRVIDVNLTGAFNCFRGVFPGMKSRREGMVINVSSMAGRQISQLGGAAYTASKHAMVALTHSINLETAQYGIRASVICPGEVDTPIIAKRPHRRASPFARLRGLLFFGLAQLRAPPPPPGWPRAVWIWPGKTGSGRPYRRPSTT